MELITYWPLLWLLILFGLVVAWRFSLVEQTFQKKMAAWVLRGIAVIALIFALCRPFWDSTSDQLHVVFLVDVSQSIDQQASIAATEEIESAIANLRSNDSWELFALANGVRQFESPEILKSWIQGWTAGSNDQFRSQTKIADSLLKSRLSFPSGKSKRIILYSDGQDTDSFLARTLRQLDEENVDIRFEKIAALRDAESAVVSLRPSTNQAYFGEIVRMSTNLSANQRLQGELRLIHRGVVVQKQPVKLEPDQPNQYFFDVDMLTPGDSQWTIELLTDKDRFPINNQRTCTVSVRGKPRILVLHEREQEMRAFVRAMKQQDMVIEVRGKFGLPETLQGMLAFDAIVLADFPATAIPPRQMNLLQRYVVDFGGGLAMLGSENSFGLGGYHQTPVEEVLPLVSRFEKEKEKPSLAMVLVIDKSGSMEGVPMALARQAAIAAVQLLGSRDQVAVVGFDSSPVIVSEMKSVVHADAIESAIRTMDAGGGTNMYPAMVTAKEMLENTTAKIRHMICLSDGHTTKADHESLTQAMTESGITVSTVALGDADKRLLARIAEIGRGRYYETNDPANVPQIFTKETMQASKSAIKEDLFGTVQTGDHRALAGFTKSDLPFTLGYVMTQPKPTAQVLLATEAGDPLLAFGRFGLGKSIAYTSDLTEKWGGEWLAWDSVGRFWGQVFRSIARNPDSQGIEIQQQLVNQNWQLEIRKTDASGKHQSKINWELDSLDSQGVMKKIGVREVGLGLYRASIPLGEAEKLTVRLRDPASNKVKVLHYNRPYPAEYGLLRKLDPKLKQLDSISPEKITEGFEPEKTRLPISYWFYFLALAAALTGVLFRRI